MPSVKEALKFLGYATVAVFVLQYFGVVPAGPRTPDFIKRAQS